jgi:hypothetical protein
MQVITDTPETRAFHAKYSYSYPPDTAGSLAWALEIRQRHIDRSRFPDSANLWGDKVGKVPTYQPGLGREAQAQWSPFTVPYRGAPTITTGRFPAQRVGIDAPAVPVWRMPGFYRAFAKQ